MLALKIIVKIFNIFVILYGLYYGILAIFPLFKKSKESKEKKPFYKFLVLIAARNEEAVIGELIDSLKKQNYPKEMYKILVVPNNCTDKTKEVCLKKGAEVLEIKEKVKSKGDVLNYVFKKYKNDKSFDAYAIFDADNVVHPDFLKEMNTELLNGYRVIQGFRDTKNLYDNWLTNGYAIFYYLQNLFLYKTRININQSANINGTGYVLLKDVITDTNYVSTTLTEDIELTALCASNDIKIGYTEKAIFYDEQVSHVIPSFKQRLRWTVGMLQTLKKYFKTLIKGFKEHKNLHVIDSLAIYVAPYLQIVMTIIGVVAFIIRPKILGLLIVTLLSYLAMVIVSIYLVIHYKKNLKKSFPGVILFPVFNFIGMLTVFVAIFKSDMKWHEIKHTRKLDINDVLNNN